MPSDESKPLGMKLTKVQIVTVSKNVAFSKWRGVPKRIKTTQNLKIYFSFEQPKSLQKSTYHLMMVLKHTRKQLTQVDWKHLTG